MNEPTYTKNTILLKGCLIDRYDEARAGAGQTIYPGMLVEKNSDNTYDGTSYNAAYAVHSTANGAAEPLVALERMYPGQPDAGVANAGGTVDDAYVAGDLLKLHYCQAGDELYMYLKTGNHALVNSFLSSAGDGTLQVSTTVPLFHSLEDVNNTSGSKVRLRVRRL